jgi:hypothetical protein
MDTQFLLIHSDTIDESAKECLEDHREVMELDNVEWEKVFKEEGAFVCEVANQ